MDLQPTSQVRSVDGSKSVEKSPSPDETLSEGGKNLDLARGRSFIALRGSSHQEVNGRDSVGVEVAPEVGKSSLFIKGYSLQGRSIEEIKVRERLLPSEWTDIEKAELEKKRDWEDRDWESIPKRAENLVWIKSNTFYKEVLDDWKEQKKSFDAKIEASKKSLGEVTNEIYNIIGFFSVFQGVILTAVSQLTQTSSLHPKPLCGKVWFPVVLSVLAAIAAVCGIALKHRELHAHEHEFQLNRQLQKVAIKREEELKKKGENFLFGGDTEERDRNRKKEDEIKPLESKVSLLKSVLVIGLVVVLTVFFILSYFVIMCDKWVIEGWK